MRRKYLPILLLAGLICLLGSAVFTNRQGNPHSKPVEAFPQVVFNPGKNPPSRPDSAAPVITEPLPATTHPPRIQLRQPGQSPGGDLAWHQALKPRPIQPKTLPTSPPGLAHRLVAKFSDPLEARACLDGSLTINADDPAVVTPLTALVRQHHLRFRPLQSASEKSLAALRKRAAIQSGTQQPDPASLVEVLAGDSSPKTIMAAARALLPLAAIEYLEIESLDAPPPPPASDIAPASPSLISYQTYRQPGQGIGIDHVWETYGIQGHPSLRFTDCEYSFNPAHEDLNGLVSLQPDVSSMYSNYGDDHGTATLGIIASGANGYGMSGALQGCQVHFYPEYATMEWGYMQNRASTITAAIADSAPGDIVMLEMQTYGPGNKYAPAEYDESVWYAVKMGTDAGVIIIAAAGNGGQNLNDDIWADYRNRGDSGAIIVGAGYSSRSRIYYSNFGNRVNLQGWGNEVATTGYGALATYGDDPNQKYTASFNGTSAATPIVASAAALLQSVSITKRDTRLSPADMRSLLISSGKPQTGVSSKQIGPLPDLTAAVPQLLAAEFSSTEPLSIPDIGEASVYPSTIPVSGVNGTVTAVRVKLNDLNHSRPWNLDVMLVSPDGQVIPLMSDAGGPEDITDTTLMFDDSAPAAIPESSLIAPGRYRPADYGFPVENPPPGVAGPSASSLNSLAASGANGDWKLYVSDDYADASGTLASWSVSFETIPFPTVDFTTASREAPENSAPFTVTATLSETATVDVTVPFSLSGSASEPADFSISAYQIFIPAGQTTGSATITLTDDSLDEEDETIILTIDPPTNGNPGAISLQTITIIDNDVTLTIASEFGDPTPGTDGAVLTEDSEVTASVTSPVEEGGTRRVCSGWIGTGSAPAEGTTTSTTFSIHQNSSITWNWETMHRLDIQTTGYGSVDAPPDWHLQDTEQTITATPEPGHRFHGWTIISGAIASGTTTDPQITLLMAEPANVTANFLPILTAREAYNAWQNTQLPTPPSTLNGVPTLLKYAFNLDGGSPNTHTLTPGSGTSGMPSLTCQHTTSEATSETPPDIISDTTVRLEYISRRNSGLIYTALQMDDPSSGPRTPMEGTRTTTLIDLDWERIIIEQMIAPLTPARFFTVEVTLPDDP